MGDFSLLQDNPGEEQVALCQHKGNGQASTSGDFSILQSKLSREQVLFCPSKEYEEAVFIGNLNYRFTTPAAVVQARSVQDVRTTINFSRKNKIQLTVKNGGHSYMGYCLNRGGIVLDLSLMNTCYIDYDKMLIDMEGGLLWKDVYYKHLDDKRNIVAGNAQLSGYGLGCDNLVEVTVITYDGEQVTLRPDHEDKDKRDLFWAMAGGGGGNFGVAVSLTSRMHKLRDEEGKVVCGQLVWNLPQQQDSFDKMMDMFNTTRHPNELTVDALWSHGQNKQMTGGMTIIYNGNMDQARKVLEKFLAFVPTKIELEEMPWTKWVHQAEGWDPRTNVYHHHASFIFAEGAIVPELVSKITLLVREAADIVEITDENKTGAPKCHFLWDHIGGEIEGRAPEETAFYWRKGHYVATMKLQWLNSGKHCQIKDFVADCYATLMSHAIEQKASYVNYIGGFVPNWEEAYYGRNYPRLQEIKTRPLDDDKRAKKVHDELPVPSKTELLQSPAAQKVQTWWNRYSTVAEPVQMSKPQTDNDAFEQDAQLRQDMLRKQGL